MKYKTLFCLMVKITGLYFVVEGATRIATQAAIPVLRMFDPNMSSMPIRMEWTYFWSSAIPNLFHVAIGAYLFIGGKKIVNLAIPSNRPYCPECAYDLTGAVSERCPECGTPFRWEDVKPKGE